MAAEKVEKPKAWPIFDRIVERAAPGGLHSNPWIADSEGRRHFQPDYQTLSLLLGVPLYLKSGTQSGIPALALDVWISYELRRAGFGTDQTWPRPRSPRILPASISKLLDELPNREADPLRARIESKGVPGVTSASATILGKNYHKQVDVIITDWTTGPELLISTKRMDSSYGNNAPNRIEESYGDAKNLRLRYPLAALGFVFGLRSDILDTDAPVAEWLFDLLAKLGREDDAYHATALVLMEYASQPPPEEKGEKAVENILSEPGPEGNEEPEQVDRNSVDAAISVLPKVKILLNETPDELNPGRFLGAMVERVLGTTPVSMHREVRKRRQEPRVVSSSL